MIKTPKVIEDLNDKSPIGHTHTSDDLPVNISYKDGTLQSNLNAEKLGGKTINDLTQKNDYVANNSYAVTGGTNTAYTITLNPTPLAYVDGMQVTILPHVDSGATPTLNINGLGALTIVKQDGTAIAIGDIKANKPLSLVRVGSNFFIRSSGGGKPYFIKNLTKCLQYDYRVSFYRSLGRYLLETSSSAHYFYRITDLKTYQLFKTGTDSQTYSTYYRFKYMTEKLGLKFDSNNVEVFTLSNLTVSNSFIETEYESYMGYSGMGAISQDNNYIYILMIKSDNSGIIFKKYSINGTLVFKKTIPLLTGDSLKCTEDGIYVYNRDIIYSYNYNGDLIKQYNFLDGEFYMLNPILVNNIPSGWTTVEGTIISYRNYVDKVYLYSHY